MPTVASPVWAGVRGRCPRCGLGRLFDGFLAVAPRCEVCGLGFGGHDVGDGAAVAGTFLIGAVVVAAALVTELKFEPPVWLHLVLWMPLVVGGSLLVLRPLKGMTIGLQHRVRSLEEPPAPDGR